MNNISNLTKALLNAQKQMGSASKEAKNPFFKSKYADLPTVMEVVKGPLNENGIIVLQPASFSEATQKNYISTTLIHAETGESITSNTEVICSKPNDPQAFGAAQTYARRFGLQAMLFIPAEDDDGNTAAGRSNSQGKPAPTVTTTPSVSTGSAAKPAALVATQSLPVGSVQAAATPAEPFKKTTSFSKKKKEESTPTPVATPAATPTEQAEAF